MKVSTEATLLVVESETKILAELMFGWRDAGLTVRVVRGQKMRSVQGLFDEMAAALQFPYYFVENWPALSECLRDMDWLPLSQGVVVVILDAGQVLADESAVELATLATAIVNASDMYARPIAEGEWWDRAAVAFHVVLQTMPADRGVTGARWREAGARVEPFDA